MQNARCVTDEICGRAQGLCKLSVIFRGDQVLDLDAGRTVGVDRRADLVGDIRRCNDCRFGDSARLQRVQYVADDGRLATR